MERLPAFITKASDSTALEERIKEEELESSVQMQHDLMTPGLPQAVIADARFRTTEVLTR